MLILDVVLTERAERYILWGCMLLFFFFSVMTMEALPRRNEHLSPGLSTHDRGSGSQQLKCLGRPLHGNGESYPGTVLWKSQGSVSSEAVS